MDRHELHSALLKLINGTRKIAKNKVAISGYFSDEEIENACELKGNSKLTTFFSLLKAASNVAKEV